MLIQTAVADRVRVIVEFPTQLGTHSLHADLQSAPSAAISTLQSQLQSAPSAAQSAPSVAPSTAISCIQPQSASSTEQRIETGVYAGRAKGRWRDEKVRRHQAVSSASVQLGSGRITVRS